MQALKHSEVIQLIKFETYRPFSNVLFVSKLIERVFAIELHEQLLKNNLLVGKNYGYQKNPLIEQLLLTIIIMI